jgi:hypothetical protein
MKRRIILPQSGKINLEIFNILSEKVVTPGNEYKNGRRL